MEDIVKYKKIEPPKGLYSKILNSQKFYLIAGALTLLVYGTNFSATRSLLSNGFSQEIIEQYWDGRKPGNVFVSLAEKVFFRNPLARSGRDLAYLLNEK